MIQSLVRDGEQGGRLPRWPLANDYTGVMEGDSADNIIADAYAMGATDFNTSEALKLMLLGATTPGELSNGYVERQGIRSFNSRGYVPYCSSLSYSAGVSQTLEYSTDDSSLAHFAKDIGDSSALVAKFMELSNNWQNLFNPQTGFIQPRRVSGLFVPLKHPETWDCYVEGTAYQYRWMVPQDLDGLIAALGGDSAAVKLLNTYFTRLNQCSGTPYAWMGNEPSLLDPWIYDFAGDPAGTQSVVRRVVNRLYQPTPGGLDGNDDLGTMAAWYVWSALGMYPVIPGVSGFALASPLFPSATVYRGNGSTVTITGQGASAAAPYVKSVRVNGSIFDGVWLPLADLGPASSTISYVLGKNPTSPTGAAGASPLGGDAIRNLAGLAGMTGGGYMAPPSVSSGLRPALAYLHLASNLLQAGSSDEVSLGLRSLSEASYAIRWTVNVPVGLVADPDTGTIHMSAGGDPHVHIAVSAAAGAGAGIYRIEVHFSTGMTGISKVSRVSALVTVPAVNSLAPFFNNIGVTTPQCETEGNFDGGGRSYNAALLCAAGLRPGAVVSAFGTVVKWPYVGPGVPDNVLASGQVIPLSGSGRNLVFLGSAANGPLTGEGEITYQSGETQEFTLAFTDWTENGGRSGAEYGNSVVAQMPDRDVVNCGPPEQAVGTYVFADCVPLTYSSPIKSVTLPKDPGNGSSLHIFAIGIGDG